MDIHIQKYILNKSPVLVGGGLVGREGICFKLGELKKEKKTLCIFKADVVLKLYCIVQEEI